MPPLRPLLLGVAAIAVFAIPTVAAGDNASPASDADVAVLADPSLPAVEPIPLPYSSLPDSASLSGDILVSGSVQALDLAQEAEGIVYALALPSSSTMSEALPDTVAELTPIAQGRVATDGSFILRTDESSHLERFQYGDTDQVIAFDLIADVGGREFISAFSRSLDESGDFSDPVPHLTMTESSPLPDPDVISQLGKGGAAADTEAVEMKTLATSAGRASLIASLSSRKSANEPLDKSNTIIYSGDEYGHKIFAPRALVNRAIYLVRHTPLSCMNYSGCQTWLYWGSPKYPFAKIGETFSGSNIRGKFDYRVSARSYLGVAFAASGDIGGFYEGSTVAHESSVGAHWDWTGQNTRRMYTKQVEYKRITWWHVYYEPYVGIRLVNYHDLWNPVGDTGGFGRGTATAPISTYCVSVNADFTWVRDSNKLRTYASGVVFRSPSLISKHASYSISLSSQTGASEYAAVRYRFNRAGWVCGNTSPGPKVSPRIRSFRNAPAGWQPPEVDEPPMQ